MYIARRRFARFMPENKAKFVQTAYVLCKPFSDDLNDKLS